MKLNYSDREEILRPWINRHNVEVFGTIMDRRGFAQLVARCAGLPGEWRLAFNLLSQGMVKA